MNESREFRVYPDMVGRLVRRGGAMIADNAVVVGDVHLAEDVGIWFGVTIRGDDAAIHIGARSNIQDNSVVHVDVDAPLHMGEGVTVGHGVIVHGVEVGDYSLIGMGSTVLGGARIGAYCIIAAAHSSGVALSSQSVLVPKSMSHSSGSPFVLQSWLTPCDRSQESGTPLELQSGSPAQASGVPSLSQSGSHSSGRPLRSQS